MPKIVKIPLIILASILLLGLILWAALQTKSVQNYIADKVTESLSETLGSEVDVQAVDFNYLDHATLQHFLWKDLDGDTMIYAAKVDVDYSLSSLTAANIKLDNVDVISPKVYLVIKEGQNLLNLDRVLANLAGDSTQAAGKFSIGKGTINNGTFVLHNQNLKAPSARAFNENHIRFTNINAAMKDFYQFKDSILFKVDGLSTTESCGLKVNSLSANCLISWTHMAFTELDLYTDKSHIGNSLEFNYNSYMDFPYFIEKVVMTTALENARIHMDDIAYFSNELKDLHQEFVITGNAKGTVDDLMFSNSHITFGEDSKLEANGRITGLPNTDDAILNFNITQLKTDHADLITLTQIEDLPQELAKAGQMNFTGNFNGKLLDFSVIGVVESQLGALAADLRLDLQNTNAIYNGTVQSDSFDLGQLLDIDPAGSAGFSLQANGSGLDPDHMKVTLNGHVSHFDYLDYTYNNIDVNGLFEKNIFVGHASIDDPNVIMSFDGDIDLNNDKMLSNARTSIDRLNLQAVGLDKNYSELSLVGTVNLDGNSLDNINGSIALDSLVWQDKDDHFPLNQIKLIVKQDSINKSIVLRSDMVDASLEGKFLLSDLDKTFVTIANLVYPVSADSLVLDVKQELTAKLDLKKYHPIYDEYLVGFNFNSVSSSLSYTGSNGEVDFHTQIGSPEISSISCENLVLDIDKVDQFTHTATKLNIGEVFMGDSLLFKTVSSNGTVRDTSLFFDVKAVNDNRLSAETQAYFTSKNKEYKILFDAFHMVLNNKQWDLIADIAEVRFTNEATEFRTMAFMNEDESILIDLSFGKETVLDINPTNFELSNLNPFLGSFNTELDGLATGSINIPIREHNPIFETQIDIANFALNKDTLGTLSLKSEIIPDKNNVIEVKGDLINGLLNNFDLSGYVDFNNKEEALQLTLVSTKIPLSPFQKYLEGLVSDLKGNATANLKITGPIDKPKLSGFSKLQGMAFTVDYLQTKYKGAATLDVSNNAFTIKQAFLEDRFGHVGKASGEVTHKNFDHFHFDLTIDEMQDFECLNTTRKDNSLFFGTAYADGFMKVQGPMDDLLLTIRAKSKSGTQIKIPLDQSELGGQLSYVEFVDLNAPPPEHEDPVETTEGIQMDFNFEVTNDAQVELIFDELLGDKIKGRGHGNLRMEVNTYGDFNMYGALNIDKGDYLFTAFNIINKYFTVDPGSTISWDGDPYNATLDLTAIKREYPQARPLVEGLVAQDEAALYETPIAVDCELKLSGLLFNPNIAFDISLPSQNSTSTSVGSAFNTVFNRVKQDREEVDRQVFALLTFGSFITPSFSNHTGTTNFNQSLVDNSLSDFISGQLSNWLSQVDPTLQVGIDYQSGTDANQLNPELVVSLRKKFMDRLEVSGSYDAVSTAGINPYDVNVKYDISKDGTKSLMLFRRSVNDPTLGNFNNTTTNGLGFYYRYQFDHFWFEKDRRPESNSSDSTQTDSTSSSF